MEASLMEIWWRGSTRGAIIYMIGRLQLSTMHDTPEQNGVEKEETEPSRYGQKHDEYMLFTRVTLSKVLKAAA